MKRVLFILGLLVAVCHAKAQSYNVCNEDGTVLEIPAGENKEITFNAEQRLVKFHNIGNLTHSFATDKVVCIATESPANGTQLTYSTDFDVEFDRNEADVYDEVVETIITDEMDDESGDFLENYSYAQQVTITFSENGVTCVPSIVNGVTFTTTDKTHLKIDATVSKMRYLVKGTCKNGSLKIYSTKKFQIMLAGLELTNPTGPAINIQSGKSVYFSIGNNTTNSLCDGSTYSAPTIVAGVEEDQKGTIFSEGQLIFSGTGTLNVKSLSGHAICSDDYIRIRSGNINITEAAKDGFHTNDIFRVGRMENSSPKISINASGDGIDCGKGEVLIEAGSLNINSIGEGIKASYNPAEEANPDPLITPNVTIKGGYLSISTTGEKSSAIKANGSFTQEGGVIHAEVEGNGSKIFNCDKTVTISGGRTTGIAHGSAHIIADTDTTYAGGIKCIGDITIKESSVAIKCTGEGAKAINGDGNVTIESGEVTLLSIAPNHQTSTDSKKSRAITCIDLVQNNGALLMKAYDKAISATSITLNNGIMHAISSNDTKPVNKEVSQKSGWYMSKGEE